MRWSIHGLILTVAASCWPLTLQGDEVGSSEVSFKRQPTVTRDGGAIQIAFTVSKETDVEVAIIDEHDRVVRHIAAGMLGANPPAPLVKNSLTQTIVWDGKDDHGTLLSGKFKARVRLGISPRFDSFLLYDKDAMPPVTHVAPGPKGNLYVFYQDPTANENQGGHKLRIIDREGRFIRQLIPFPADLAWGMVKSSGAFADDEGRLVPQTHNWHRLAFCPSTNLTRGRDFSASQCPIVDDQGRIYWIMDGCQLCAVNAEAVSRTTIISAQRYSLAFHWRRVVFR